IAVVGLLILASQSRFQMRPLMTAPAYALVFGGLLFATHTLSFSVSNNAAFFGARLATLGTVAAIAQLGLGGRPSLVPAALVTSLAVLALAVVAAHQPLAPADGTFRFLPIPALSALAFACLTIATMGTQARRHARPSALGGEAQPPAVAVPGGLLAESHLPPPPEAERPGRLPHTAGCLRAPPPQTPGR